MMIVNNKASKSLDQHVTTVLIHIVVRCGHGKETINYIYIHLHYKLIIKIKISSNHLGWQSIPYSFSQNKLMLCYL